jgi:hypothetical protein
MSPFVVNFENEKCETRGSPVSMKRKNSPANKATINIDLDNIYNIKNRHRV